MRPSSVVLAALATATSLQLATAQQALSGWIDGIATNYGTSAVQDLLRGFVLTYSVQA